MFDCQGLDEAARSSENARLVPVCSTDAENASLTIWQWHLTRCHICALDCRFSTIQRSCDDQEKLCVDDLMSTTRKSWLQFNCPNSRPCSESPFVSRGTSERVAEQNVRFQPGHRGDDGSWHDSHDQRHGQHAAGCLQRGRWRRGNSGSIACRLLQTHWWPPLPYQWCNGAPNHCHGDATLQSGASGGHALRHSRVRAGGVMGCSPCFILPDL